MKRFSLLFFALVVLVAGCGSSSKQSAPPAVTILAPADSEQQWAYRIVDLFLRPLNSDLQVLNALRDPNVVIYLGSGNKTTLNTVNKALDDLGQCQTKLRTIGAPPPQSGPFEKVNRDFQAACAGYVPSAATLKKAVVYWSSGRSDVVPRGFTLLRSTAKTVNRAGAQYLAGIRIAQRLPEFRRAGLKPSA
jgi:hypothetical protein